MFLSSPVIGCAASGYLVAVTCADGTLHSFSPADGFRLLPALKLAGSAVLLRAQDRFVAAVTSQGWIHVWDVLSKKSTVRASILSLLDGPDGSTSTTISSCNVRDTGCPMLGLSNGKTYTYSPDMDTWWEQFVWPCIRMDYSYSLNEGYYYQTRLIRSGSDRTSKEWLAGSWTVDGEEQMVGKEWWTAPTWRRHAASVMQTHEWAPWSNWTVQPNTVRGSSPKPNIWRSKVWQLNWQQIWTGSSPGNALKVWRKDCGAFVKTCWVPFIGPAKKGNSGNLQSW